MEICKLNSIQSKSSDLQARIKVYLKQQKYTEQLKNYLRACFYERSKFFNFSQQNQYSYRPELRTQNQKLLKMKFPTLDEVDLKLICGTVVSHELIPLHKSQIVEIFERRQKSRIKAQQNLKKLREDAKKILEALTSQQDRL